MLDTIKAVVTLFKSILEAMQAVLEALEPTCQSPVGKDELRAIVIQHHIDSLSLLHS